MLKAFKYRLYTTPDQEVLLNKHLGCARWVYNYALSQKIQSHENTGVTMSRFDVQSHLPGLKKAHETKWLSEVNSQCLHAALKNLDTAYKGFFKEKKGFPKFKSKYDYRQSFECPQKNRVDFENGCISILKVKNIKCCFSRTFSGTIKKITISKTPTGKFFASILVDNCIDLPDKCMVNKKTTIGIDTGIKTFLTLSNGESFENPKYLRKSIERLKVIHARASKKVKGSNNRKKANLRTARLYEKITNQRLDYIHKVTAKLTKENQFSAICIEDLNVKGMVKNHCLAQALSDVSIGKFYEILAYKCEWYGVSLFKIGRFESSSKTCSSCGNVNKDLTLADREWKCEKCNTTHDRDLNAAKNIKSWGLRNSGAGCSGGPVESLALVRAKKQEKVIKSKV